MLGISDLRANSLSYMLISYYTLASISTARACVNSWAWGVYLMGKAWGEKWRCRGRSEHANAVFRHARWSMATCLLAGGDINEAKQINPPTRTFFLCKRVSSHFKTFLFSDKLSVRVFSCGLCVSITSMKSMWQGNPKKASHSSIPRENCKGK